ncbi:hypothetical protein V8E53_014945 [Lactarius tabidus]
MMRLSTVFIILPSISAYALSSSVSFLGDSPLPSDPRILDSALSEDPFDSASRSYAKKPDCFRRAAGRIRSRCADIEMDADERVKAAISMTLCELRTAEFHSIPLECEVLLEEGTTGGRMPHGVCVEALSRSTQSWASYSGYLREIPQLCFAYQRSNEKDLALEIYRNATIEKVAYIRRLMQHAEREDEMRTLWQSLLSDLQRSVDDLQASPGIAERIYTDIAEKVFGELQQVLRVHQETFDVQLQQSIGHSLALSHHSQTLMDLSTEFERSLSSRLDSVYGLLDNQLSRVFTASDEIWQRVSFIEGGLISAMNALTQLSLSTSHLSEALNSSVVEVQLMHATQADAVRATARLAGTLQRMNETVMSALADINTTAVKVNNTLGAGSFSLYAHILSSASAFVAYLNQNSFLRLFIRSLWFIFHRSSSLIAMPCIAAVFSLVRAFLRKILPGCGCDSCCPCVSRFRASSRSGQASLVPITPAALPPTQATSWPRRRPFPWRSSQVSRIPDRLCRRFGD